LRAAAEIATRKASIDKERKDTLQNMQVVVEVSKLISNRTKGFGQQGHDVITIAKRKKL